MRSFGTTPLTAVEPPRPFDDKTQVGVYELLPCLGSVLPHQFGVLLMGQNLENAYVLAVVPDFVLHLRFISARHKAQLQPVWGLCLITSTKSRDAGEKKKTRLGDPDNLDYQLCRVHSCLRYMGRPLILP